MRRITATLALTVSLLGLVPASALANHTYRTVGRATVEHVVLCMYDENGACHMPEPYTVHQWPGVYFETRFKGRDLNLRFSDGHNRFKLYIDEDMPVIIDTRRGDSWDHKVKKGGWHTARLEKISESQGNTGAFHDFFTANSRFDPPPARARQIEFVGDSWTVGYGNTSPKQECSEDEVWATTDTSQAFGPITAKHFDADYQINAYSGRGVVRNYDGIAPGEPLPAVYPYVLFDKETLYEDDSWKPHLIVIGLGGNDFSTPVKAGEKWASEEALAADFEASYVFFLKELRRRNPGAFLLVMNYDGPRVAPHVDAVVAAMKAGGETRIDSLTMGDFALTGCHWHLDLNDHRRISTQLNTWIEAHPDLWSYK